MDSKVETFPPVDDDIAIERFSNANPQWRVEIDAAGIYSLSPTHSEGGATDFAAALQLSRFAERHGGKVFGAAAGFRLADGSLRAPDASWISDEHSARLSPEDKPGFWRTCPDIVIEILSTSDTWSARKNRRLHAKRSRLRRSDRPLPHHRRIAGRAPPISNSTSQQSSTPKTNP